MQSPSRPYPAPRVVQLDALRGIAVIGIAWMNVYAFALPLQAYYNPAVFGMESAADRWVWAAGFVFVEDKFRTLFAMLFGAGCLILLERDNERPMRGHYARMAVLFLIGLAHSVFLASNDVLRAYAMAGLALPFLARLSSFKLYAIAIGLVAVHVGAGINLFGTAIIDFYQGRLNSDASLFAERNFGVAAGAVENAMRLGQESIADRVPRRIEGIPAQLRTLLASLPINLAAMVLGMALWRDRMLAAEWRTFRYQRLAATCAALSLPFLLAIVWWVSSSGFPGALMGAAALVVSAPFDMLLGLAYAALVMTMVSSKGVVAQRIAAVGRLSLTNYIATSVVLAAIFASWGLGLFAQLSRAQSFAVSFVPIAGMLLWSPLWLAQFQQGPLEWVWRRAARVLS